GDMFSTSDCTTKGWRQKDDAYGVSFSCLLRSCGPKSAPGPTVAYSVLPGVFEAVGGLLSQVFNEGARPQLPP
ncbi:hypothetical protein EDC04DRAFT_2519128, partial [Pisolithus marmoratus]